MVYQILGYFCWLYLSEYNGTPEHENIFVCPIELDLLGRKRQIDRHGNLTQVALSCNFFFLLTRMLPGFLSPHDVRHS